MSVEKLLELENVQGRIHELREELGELLKQEQRLLTQRAADEGCTCLFMILDLRVERVVNHYCKATHHPRR